MEQKRYLLLVQHEVIMYGEDEKAAQSSLFHSQFARDRTNLKCVYIQEIPFYWITQWELALENNSKGIFHRI